MASSITLGYGGTTYTVVCTGVTIGWNNNLYDEPDTNNTAVTEVQTNGFNNPIYSLSGVHLTEATSTLTYSALLTMAKSKYSGSNPITLTITKNDEVLPNSAGSSTGISCVVKSFNFPINVDEYDVAGTRKPLLVGTIVLEETA